MESFCRCFRVRESLLALCLQWGAADHAGAETTLPAASGNVVITPTLACERLADLRLPNTTITAAQPLTGGSFTPPGLHTITNLPPFCRVTGVIAPTIQSHIVFELWMPLENWNGRFSGVGGYLWGGLIRYENDGPQLDATLAEQLRRGNATAATNGGHDSNDPCCTYGLFSASELDQTGRFGFEYPEQLIDHGYRAYHETTVKAKNLVETFYGKAPDHSYSIGCTGGEGLMEAQRFPGDYDGIIACAPPINWTRLMTLGLDVATTVYNNNPSKLTGASMRLVLDAALLACDTVDGVVDSIIGNPLRCRFDPATLKCADAQKPTACLTSAQLEAVRHLYLGLRDPNNGAQLYPGMSVGFERNTGRQLQEFIAPFRWLVFGDPNWEWRSFSFTNPADYRAFLAGEAKLAPILNTTNPDLGEFRGRGAKLIEYHGWADGEFPAQSGINYYESVVSFSSHGENDRSKVLREVQTFFRLFMVPGMRHHARDQRGTDAGSRPPDALTFDMQTALELWVEHGIAPDVVTASYFNDGFHERSRPLCPYPQSAVYAGRGDPRASSSFACREN